MTILAIDTSTEVLSVGLTTGTKGKQQTLVLNRRAGLRHTSKLMQYIDFLFTESGLSVTKCDVISCAEGPGSFTGLRIGMATAKGLARAVADARALHCPPLVSIPTLAAMAHPFHTTQCSVLAVIDGKKGRFYASAFCDGNPVLENMDLTAEGILSRLLDSGSVPLTKDILVVGPHADRFVADCGTLSHDVSVVSQTSSAGSAESLLTLAPVVLEKNGFDDISKGPVYVRASDAEIGVTTKPR